MTEPISPDLPEFRLLAQFVGVAPARMAAAFNDPEHFLSHMTVEELQRFTDGFDRVNALMARMRAAQDIAIAAMRKGGF